MARTPTLYGPDGRPVRRQLLLRQQAAPSLASVRQPWMADAVAEHLTPSRVAAVIRAANEGETRDYCTLAEELEERWAGYGAALGVRRRAVLGVEPSVESASDAAADVALADEIRGLVRAPEFRRMLSDCLAALGPGLAAVEILWDRSGPEWKPREYRLRDPRWFRWSRNDANELLVLADEDQAEGVPLRPFQWIVHVPRLRPGIPARGGLARPAAALHCLASWSLADWAAWLEGYGRPIRIGKYDAGATEDDRRVLQRAVSMIGSDSAATIPASMEVELLEAARSSSSDAYERFERWLDEQAAIVVLGQTATTQGTPGRLGSDEAQAEVRSDILEGDCEELAATLNRDLVRPWVDLNRGPQAEYPRIVLQPQDPEDIKVLAQALRMLVPFGLRVESSVVRDRMGLPDPPEGAEVLEAPARTGPGPASVPAEASVRSAAAAARDRLSLLEELEAQTLDGWERVMDPLLAPVRELLARSETPGEFLAGLADALGAQDTEPLARALASATFAARGLGDARDGP
ncbi:MAG: DUF935 domain-containing protein [Chromatiales bacterium]|nr:DUF935 domain-containing protein [Chromatiales bacterium]